MTTFVSAQVQQAAAQQATAQQANGPQTVSAGAHRLFTLVQVNKAVAQCGYIDFTLTGDSELDCTTISGLLKAQDRNAVPRGRRIKCATKFGKLCLGTWVSST